MKKKAVLKPYRGNFAVKIFLLILMPGIYSDLLLSQDEDLSSLILNIAEELSSDDSDQESGSFFIEQLFELADNPVKLNSADESEISRLFFLTQFQVKSLIDYTQKSGAILSIYEIAVIPGFDRQVAELIIPFIELTENDIKPSSGFRLRSNLLTNFSIKPGEKDTSLTGSPWKILSKYRFTAGNFYGGINAEKDAGETFIPDDKKPPLPDFWSANLAWEGGGFIRKIIIGDYSACFGYGTNVNTRMRAGFSLSSSGYMPLRDDIRPYTSSDENRFFRGIAAELSYGKFLLNLLYSYNYLDATLTLSDDSAETYVSNLYTSGLHTTPQLMLKKDVAGESFYCANMRYNSSSYFRLGATITGSSFSVPLRLKNDRPEEFFEFEGSYNNIYSFYYNILINRTLIYGEVSADKDHDLAFIHGISARPAERLSINMLYRNYSPGFNSLHSGAPGINTSTSNEHGILGGFTFEAARYLFISAGYDITSFPWLKYRCSFPSRAKRSELRIKYIPSEMMNIELVYSYRYSITDMNDKTGIPSEAEIKSGTFRSTVRYSPSENIQFTTRADLRLVNDHDSKGMMILQDIKYIFRSIPLTLWYRHCIFNTDDWNSRIYAYENDLLYNFSIPALSGKGSLSYLMLKWELSDIAELRFKYRLMTTAAINSSSKNSDEIKLQLRMFF